MQINSAQQVDILYFARAGKIGYLVYRVSGCLSAVVTEYMTQCLKNHRGKFTNDLIPGRFGSDGEYNQINPLLIFYTPILLCNSTFYVLNILKNLLDTLHLRQVD